MYTNRSIARIVPLLMALFICAPSFAAGAAERTMERVGNTGVSGLWILANISYAGMRAQGSRSRIWRIVAFIFGFPGTLVTFIAVDAGSDRAYGIDLPRR